MTEIKHGSVTVIFPDHLTPSDEAGRLTDDDKRKLPKARRGVGLVCEQTASALEIVGARFKGPPLRG